MNRKYLDKSAAVFGFIVLVTLLLEWLFPSSLKALGFIALLWSIISVAILLWIEERYHYLRSTLQVSGSHLPSKLIAEMDRQAIYDQGMLALKGLNPLVLGLFIAGGIYMLAGLNSLISPALYEPLMRLDERLNNYFSTTLETENMFGAGPVLLSKIFAVLTHILPLFIAGLGIWICQIYAYGTRTASYLLWICSFAFVSATLAGSAGSYWLGFSGLDGPVTLWAGYGWDNLGALQTLGAVPHNPLSAYQIRLYESGMLAVVAFYVAPALLAFTYLRNLLTGTHSRIKSLAGLALLAILFIQDALMSAPSMPVTTAVSGWCCLSLLSVTRKFGMRKIYRMYQ
jgi:hypothetical protein